ALPAAAQTDRQPGEAGGLSLEAATDFPISIGLRATLELPMRLRIWSSLGVLPGPYLRAVNSAMVAAEVYDTTTASLIEASLDRAVVWRTHAGWRPFSERGFYFGAGYGLVTLGGGLSSAEALQLLLDSGVAVPQGARDALGVLDLSARATLHQLSAELGWEFAITESLLLRTGIGGVFTVASSSRLAFDLPVAQDRFGAALLRRGEAYLDDVFVRYVHTPVLTVGIGYSVF
ncbi:MAG: hypothetical protein ACK4N5_26420, partial [Myxococcales bacterium]